MGQCLCLNCDEGWKAFYSAQAINVVPEGSTGKSWIFMLLNTRPKSSIQAATTPRLPAKRLIRLDRANHTIAVDRVTLRVAMGALCDLTVTSDTLKVGYKSKNAAAGGAAMTPAFA